MEPQARTPMLYALLQDHWEDDPRASGIEIVDLETRELVRSFSLGPRNATSLAVGRGGGPLYVVDVRGSEIAIYDLLGDQTGAVRLDSPPRDCVLAHGGGTLYVSTRNGVVAVDTATERVVAKQPSDSDLDGVAVAPGDEVVGAAAYEWREDGSLEPALYLFRTGSPAPVRVPLTDPERRGPRHPSDVAFTDTGRAILWDGSSDTFFQVDVADAVQDPAGTAHLERDHGGLANTNNVVVYSRPAKRAYALKEFAGTSTSPGVLAVLDPDAAKAHEVGGFAAQPFVLALDPDERKLYVSVVRRWMGGGADMLDEYDVEADSFDRRVYTFQRDDMSVRDMKIL
jgi:hypothetical protein